MTLAADRQSHTQRIGHLLVIEGSGLVFTNITSLVGTDYLGDGRQILPGLELPNAIRHAVNVREGLLTDSSVRFTVLDDGHNAAGQVAQMFRATHDEGTVDRIFETVPSTEDPVTSKQGAGGAAVTLAGRHLGTELFDGSGGRRDRYIHPGDAPPPMHHSWAGGEFGGEGMPALEVSDNITVWEGREIALHELIWDTANESWSTWVDQYDSASMIFHGTMRGRGQIIGTSKYQIDCFNEASLCRRVLNRDRASESFGLLPKLRHDDSQAGFAVAFQSQYTLGITNVVYDSSFFDNNNDLTAITLDALRTEINGILDDVADGTSGNYSGASLFADTFGAVSFSTDSLSIKFSHSATPATYFGRAFIVMHQKYWAMLGFDPNIQGSVATTSPDYINFKPFIPSDAIVGTSPTGHRNAGPDLDYTGYWTCEIRTIVPTGVESGANPDNGGNFRDWPAVYPGGMTTVDPSGGQEVGLLMSGESVPSQLALPPADLCPADARPEIDGTPVDSMGWFLLTGKIARAATQDGSQDFDDYAQVARCSWVASGEGIDTDADGLFPAIRIECFEDPRAFGLPFDKITAPWLAGGTSEIRATPIAWFGAYRMWQGSTETLPDSAHRVITRIMLSTGTSTGWASSEPLPYITAGDNQPSSLLNSASVLGTDVEISDMGLGIDQAEIDFASFEETHLATIGSSRLGLVTAAFRGPVKSQDLIGSLMQGRGWCMSWRILPGETRSRFGCVDFYSVPGAAEMQYTDPATNEQDYLLIDDSDLGGRTWEQSIPRVNQSWRVPVDTFKVQSGGNIETGGTEHSAEFPSTDKGARRRQGAATFDIDDPTLSDPSLFDGGDQRNWRPGAIARYSKTIGPFMGLPHRVVTLSVASWKGRYLGPGQAFALTSSMVNSLNGLSLGVSVIPCRVLSQIYNPNAGLYKVKAVMYGIETTNGPGAVWGGMVRGRVATNPSGDTYTITVEQDWCDAGHNSSDTELAFIDPGYVQDSTNPVADILESFNGVDWWYSGQGTVTARTDTTVTVNMLSGASLYSDTYKILTLAPTDDQAGWAATVGKVAYVATDASTVTGTTETAGKLG